MKTTNNTTSQTNFRIFVLFILLVLSSAGVFAQTKTSSDFVTTSTEFSISKEATNVISIENSVTVSMDFAIWYMGSIKTTNNSSNGSFSKKQLINSGINTNNVLIRSFLKKMSSQENGVA